MHLTNNRTSIFLRIFIDILLSEKYDSKPTPEFYRNLALFYLNRAQSWEKETLDCFLLCWKLGHPRDENSLYATCYCGRKFY